jgi:HEPN domain-containing protein
MADKSIMADNFGRAAYRHRKDAEKLADHGRYQNAGYLIGYAAECRVKELLTRYNIIKVGPNSEYRKHFPELRIHIRLHSQGRIAKGLAPALTENFLKGWVVDLRYEGQIAHENAQQRWERWRKDVERLFKLKHVKRP